MLRNSEVFSCFLRASRVCEPASHANLNIKVRSESSEFVSALPADPIRVAHEKTDPKEDERENEEENQYHPSGRRDPRFDYT